MFGIAIGSVMWALVVGTICGISATGNPFNMAFKHNMDQLNYFLEDMQMPIELRHRSREFLRNARDLGKKHSYNEVVERLSPEVKKDCVLTMSLKTLQVSDALSLCRLPGTSQPSPCNLPAPHDRAAV